MKTYDATRTPILPPKAPRAPSTPLAPTEAPPSTGVAPSAMQQVRNTDAFSPTATEVTRAPTAAPRQWVPAPRLDNVRKGGGLVTLSPGMEGDGVKDLQRMLGLPAAQQDGKFGEGTRAAVESFQKSAGLKVPPGLEGQVGATTLQVLEKAAASRPTSGAGATVNLDQELASPRSLLSRAIGHAEGNLDVKGNTTGAYDGHSDYGNGKLNKGTFSYQHGATTPEQADQAQLAKFRAQRPAYEAAARTAGLDPNNPLLAAAYFDTFTQSEAAANLPGGFLDQLPELARKGVTPENIIDLRVRSYVDPSTGRLDAPAFGNDPAELRRDQTRRMDALVSVLQGEGKGGTTPSTGGPQTGGTTPWTPAPSSADVATGKAVLKQGMQGESVKDLQKLLGIEADGKFGKGTADAVAAFQKVRRLQVPSGMEGQVGGTTLETLKKAAASGPVGAGQGSVNANHPLLQKLATASLDNGPYGMCVATTMGNLDKLGVPSFSGGTSDDPNNPRGALVRMMREGGWASVPLPGSEPRRISSPAFGDVTAHVIPADAYERMAQAGQIPSGALIFQTRHGWDYNGGSNGNDMGIVRDNGRVTHNFESMPPIIYGDAKEVVLLVPKDALQ